jgi:hypothetical protein
MVRMRRPTPFVVRIVVNEGGAELRFGLYSLTAYQALKTRQKEHTMKVRQKRFTILS